MLDIEDIIKGKMAENKLNISKIANMLGISKQTLYSKFKRNSLSIKIAQEILDFCGYELTVKKK
jgi:DNA-binding NtrC family response regulator